MKRYRVVTLALVCMAVMVMVVYAADASMGTWKLNLAKSKYDPANLAPKSQTEKRGEAEGGVTQVTDIVDYTGKAIHIEYTAKYDGKDYPVKGDPNRDTISVKRIDDFTREFTNKKGGKVTTSGKSVVFTDGKTRTVTSSGTNAQGQKVSNIAVYDKQ